MILDVDQAIAAFWATVTKDTGGPSHYTFSDGVSVTLLDFSYDQVSPVTRPDVIIAQNFFNGTDEQEQGDLNIAQSTQASFKWSVTAGVKLGAKASFDVGVPEIADAKVEASIELSLSATQEQTTTKTQSWNQTSRIPIPPHSAVHAEAVVLEAVYSPNFTATIRLEGWCGAKANEPKDLGGGRYRADLSAPITAVLKGLPGCSIDDSGVTYHASGKFAGVQGITLNVKTSQSPYTPELLKAESLVLTS